MTWQTYVKHYVAGLLATSVNGGIASVAAVVAAKQAFTVHNLIHDFAFTAGAFALSFLNAHPFPVPSLSTDKSIAAASAALK